MRDRPTERRSILAIRLAFRVKCSKRRGGERFGAKIPKDFSRKEIFQRFFSVLLKKSLIEPCTLAPTMSAQHTWRQEGMGFTTPGILVPAWGPALAHCRRPFLLSLKEGA